MHHNRKNSELLLAELYVCILLDVNSLCTHYLNCLIFFNFKICTFLITLFTLIKLFNKWRREGNMTFCFYFYYKAGVQVLQWHCTVSKWVLSILLDVSLSRQKLVSILVSLSILSSCVIPQHEDSIQVQQTKISYVSKVELNHVTFRCPEVLTAVKKRESRTISRSWLLYKHRTIENYDERALKDHMVQTFLAKTQYKQDGTIPSPGEY